MSSVSSSTFFFSIFDIALYKRSLSLVGGMDPEGDEVRGGVPPRREVVIEMGVLGCSGAEAVASRDLGSKRRESWDVDREGDVVPPVPAVSGWSLSAKERTCPASLSGSWIACTISLRDMLTRDSTMESMSSEGTMSIVLIRRDSSPVNTSFRTTGESEDRSSYPIDMGSVPANAAL